MIKKILTLFICIICLETQAQTFNCYVANDSLLSSTEYKFDVYLEATSADLYLRAIQMGFSFDTMFISSGATVSVSPVSGSTELLSYIIGTPVWNSTYSCLSIPANSVAACNTTPNPNNNILLPSATPKRVSSYILTSTLPFNCQTPDISMIRPTDPAPGLGILKMSISEWSDSCVATTITNSGSFTHFPGVMYSTVNNPLDTNCLTNVSELQEYFEIYPNPATEKIIISSSGNLDARVEIYNHVGSLVRIIENMNRSKRLTIDLTSFPVGVYFLKMGNATQRFVKSN